MVDGDGVIGASLQRLFDDPSLGLKASTGLTWTMLIVRHLAHLTVQFHNLRRPTAIDTLEAAQVDGANKWQRMIHVVVPHLMPLVSFVT